MTQTVPDIADTILALCAKAGPGKTIDPGDAAKAHADATGGDDMAWRNWLQQVRRTAVKLATDGRLVIYRKGKLADPADFRGVYRLGVPHGE